MAQVKLSKNADNTITVRCGRKVRHVPCDIPKAKLFEEIKWAAIGMDATIPEVVIIEFLYEGD